ncbi:PAS domain S-box protein [Haloarchaeobius sp. HME9146]|nr:histidine kinase N-terminal 7TM domain-containing protein [Haloarchaeobius sp. HME9146]MCT9096545.1 PAS domain S-box protein [Haloarchaeobius sp. HME9146]
MPFEQLAYVGLLVFSMVVLAALGSHALRTARGRPDHRRTLLLFGLFMFGSAFWSGTYSLQLAATDESTKLFWLSLSNVGAVIVPGAWLLFALSYVGKDRWLRPWTTLLLVIEPLVVVGVLALGQSDLFWYNTGVVEEPFPLLTRELGPLFQVHAMYSYLLILFGTAVLVQWARRKQGVYRGQAALLITGSAVPTVFNVAFLVGFGPANVNLTAPLFVFSGLAFWTAIARYRLLDVVPVARESVIENMRDGYLVIDDQGRIVDTNPAATRLLRDSSLVGDRIDSVLPAAAGLLAALRDGDTDDADDRTELVIGDDHDRRYVDMSVSPLGTETGSSLVVLRDITDRRSTERRFKTLIENSSDLVTVVNEDGVIEYQSPSTEQLLGYDPEAMTGANALTYVHPADREELAAVFEAGLNEDEYTARTEYRVRHTDGEWRTYEALSRNLLDDPAVEGVVINSRDITERKRRERELAETNERLDQFASVVSHDLRNPLNVAQGYVELLDELVDGEADQYVDEVAESHDRMERIIDDVLALARDGTEIAERHPVELTHVARDAWSNVDTAQASLVTRTDSTVPADRSLLVRVFENLFRNSIEHSDEGDLTVVVEDLPDEAGFAVADDGPGIDAAVRDELFEPGVTGSQSGTGLGLAIVERIVEAHDWEIRLADAANGSNARPESTDGGIDGDVVDVEPRPSGARFEILTGD